MSVTAIILVLYMLALIAIGFWAARVSKTEEDFVLGGRRLGPIVAGLAYAASTSSAWVLLGYTTFVANVGLSALWMVPGILTGYVIVWFWLGPYLADISRKTGALTVLGLVVGDAQGVRRLLILALAAFMILFCFAFYVAAQFQGAGNALADILAVSPTLAVLIGAAVIVAYTFLGGFLAVSLTDTLQGMAIVLIAVIVPLAVLVDAQGPADLWNRFASLDGTVTDPFGGQGGAYFLFFLGGVSAIGLGALGQPHLLTWVIAVRDRRARLYGGSVAVAWGVLVYTGMTIIALAARASAGADAPLGETLLLDAATKVLPGILPALVYAAILSAIMSTVDSQLLVASTTISHDLGAGRRFPGYEVLITRLVIIVVCAAAVALTLFVPDSIFTRVLFAWSALGAAFGPVLVCRAAGWTISSGRTLAAMVTGFGCAVLFNQFLDSGPGAWAERLLPWLLCLCILLAGNRRRTATTSKPKVLN